MPDTGMMLEAQLAETIVEMISKEIKIISLCSSNPFLEIYLKKQEFCV